METRIQQKSLHRRFQTKKSKYGCHSISSIAQNTQSVPQCPMQYEPCHHSVRRHRQRLHQIWRYVQRRRLFLVQRSVACDRRRRSRIRETCAARSAGPASMRTRYHVERETYKGPYSVHYTGKSSTITGIRSWHCSSLHRRDEHISVRQRSYRLCLDHLFEWTACRNLVLYGR